MTIIRQFKSALQALTGVHPDDLPLLAQPQPATLTPSLSLADGGAIPREALFLGMASDGLPVLLNLHDPLPGPLLITGDEGVGKTSLLQMIVHVAQQTHSVDDLQYAVITPRPEEWDTVASTQHQVGIFSATHPSAKDVLLSLAGWAHAHRSTQAVLLLIDDLEVVAGMDSEVLSSLRWLLLRGPNRRVWLLVTVRAARYGQVLGWIPMFRTRIFGQVTQPEVASALGGDEASALGELEAGRQFSLRENGRWIRFWMPGV